jgi:hypothetical protein
MLVRPAVIGQFTVLARLAVACSGIRQNSDACLAEFWRIPLQPSGDRT